MSDCSCIYIDADDEPQFYNQRLPIARKEHTCGECGRKIEPGETYENFSAKWDSIGFFTYKTCNDCLSIRHAFFCESWIAGEIYENLWEHISEVDGQISTDCILSLTPKAKERVLDMIDTLWEDE